VGPTMRKGVPDHDEVARRRIETALSLEDQDD
jgi:hypothetical protein